MRLLKTRKFLKRIGWSLAAIQLLATGCGEEAGEPSRDVSGRNDAGSGSSADGGIEDAALEGEPLHVWHSFFFGTEDTTAYVKLLDSLEPQTIDYGEAREFAGYADVWVHEGSIFVTDPESLSITKFRVRDRALVEGERISFAAYGITELGFWVNKFVSATKAYLLNGPHEYIVWNPETMEIRGTLPLPGLERRPGFKSYPGYSDRAAILRGTRLYQPLYWTDDDYFGFTPDSRIAVIDTVHDEVVDLLEAPCPGLDYATQDEQGDLYFSSWVFAPGGAAVLDQPATCVVKIAAGEDVVVKAFDVADLTDGRQGGVLRYLGGGRALLSVLHDDNSSSVDVREVANGPNWRFWTYDFESGTAAPLDSVPWNAGAAYAAVVDGQPFMLVPSGDYTSTTLYRLDDGDPEPVFEANGWTTRLFAIRGELSGD